MKKLLVLLAVFGSIGAGYVLADESKVAVAAVNGLSVDLYKKLAAEEKGNLFFSPYSISDALAMTYGGARAATAQEMAKTLHFPGPLEQTGLDKSFLALNDHLAGIQKKGNIKINVANALWLQSDYNEGEDHFKCKDEFLNFLRAYYRSELNAVNYRDVSRARFIRDTINAWVEQKTNNKIKDLIPSDVPDRDTRLILVNAIYFKGKWQDAFKIEDTKPTPFYFNAGDKKDVATMCQQNSFQYAEDDSAQVVTMPYEGYDLSIVIILPKDQNGLPALEEQLTAAKLDSWAKSRGRREEVRVYLPKFKLESAFMLADTLKAMGMPLAFDPGRADFSGMADFPATYHLYISKVIHKAFIDVYEEGTEAAAATAVVMEGLGCAAPAKPQEPKIFRADHPFLFFIQDNATGAILFLGRYVKPE